MPAWFRNPPALARWSPENQMRLAVSRAFPKSAGLARSAIAKSSRRSPGRRWSGAGRQTKGGRPARRRPRLRFRASAVSTASRVGSASITRAPADSKSCLPLGAIVAPAQSPVWRHRRPLVRHRPHSNRSGPICRPSLVDQHQQSPSPSIHSPKSALTARDLRPQPIDPRCAATERRGALATAACSAPIRRPWPSPLPLDPASAWPSGTPGEMISQALCPTNNRKCSTSGRLAASSTKRSGRNPWNSSPSCGRYSAVGSIRSRPPNRRLVRTASSASARRTGSSPPPADQGLASGPQHLRLTVCVADSALPINMPPSSPAWRIDHWPTSRLSHRPFRSPGNRPADIPG